jgi:hypothetical protein
METKSSTLHMLQWSLIFWRATSFLRKLGLTSKTTCLDSSNVLLANFGRSTGSSMWDRLLLLKNNVLNVRVFYLFGHEPE